MLASEFVGKRILATVKGFGYGSQIEEYQVLEVSPSGNYIRLMNAFGKKFWKPIVEVQPVEMLLKIEPNPSKKV